MNTYDWADSWAAFEMAYKHKTHYLYELENPRMEAKLLATVYRKQKSEQDEKIKRLCAKYGVEVNLD